MPEGWGDLVAAVLLPQLGMILAPTLLMAIMLTTSIRSSLRIRLPGFGALFAAVLLGVTLHPLYSQLGQWIAHLIPMSDAALEAMRPIEQMLSSQPLGAVIFVVAVIPAICEELTFRGFIFGGLSRNQGGLRAVLVTAVMFGFSHAIFQQSVAATLMGCVLGWIALRTGSVLPGILFHITNNALSVSVGRIQNYPELYDSPLGYLVQQTTDGTLTVTTYQPVWIAVSASLAFACLMYFSLYQNQNADDLDVQRDREDWLEEHEATIGNRPDSDVPNEDRTESASLGTTQIVGKTIGRIESASSGTAQIKTP